MISPKRPGDQPGARLHRVFICEGSLEVKGYTGVLLRGHWSMEAPSLLTSEALDPQRLIVETGLWHGCCKTRDPKVGPVREAGGMAYTGARSRFPAGP